jgi:LysR family transcriptional regulator (chromosome initiation inhibitor)
VTPEALAASPSLVFDEKDTLQHRWAEAVTGRKLLLAGHRLPSSTAFVEAALLGLGWGMNPEPLVRDHLAAGRLVALLPDRPLDTPLVWQASRIGRATLAPLTAAVRRAARKALVALSATAEERGALPLALPGIFAGRWKRESAHQGLRPTGAPSRRPRSRSSR